MTQAYEIGGDDAQRREPDARRDADESERPIGAIVTDLWEKTETLVRQEMKLGLSEAEERVDALKVELEGKVQQLKLELLAVAIGAVVAFAGLLAIVAGLVMLLALLIKPWLAACIVGAALAVVGTVLLKRDVKTPEGPAPADLLPSG